MKQLKNLQVLVTRPEPQATELMTQITARGGIAIHMPTLAFAPPPDPIAFQQALHQLGEQDWLIFISPQAVYSSVVPIRTLWPNLPDRIKFAALGAGTAQALVHAGYNVTVTPETEWNSESFLALAEFQNIVGKKIAIVRGEGGREKVDRTLEARGAHLLPVIAYARVMPVIDIAPYLALLEQHKIDVIVCTSYEGVRNLKQLVGDRGWIYIKDLPIVVMSERIKLLAQDLGFQTLWVTHNASTAAVIELLENMRG